MAAARTSEITYRGRAFNLRTVTARLRSGRQGIWEVLDHPGGVAMVAVDAQGGVLLVRQFRAAVGAPLLEVPAGTCEAGEQPHETAARELQEEVGMRAEHLTLLGKFYVAPGYTSELLHAYLATGLTASVLPADEDEELSIERVPLADLLLMIKCGEIEDGKTITAVLLAAAHPLLAGGGPAQAPPTA